MSVHDLASRLAVLPPEKRALFERELLRQEQAAAARQSAVPPAAQRRAGRAAAPAPIPRRPPSDLCPLSVDQERLWFIQQLDLDSPIYNIYGADRFRGPLSVVHLARALAEVVRRHEVLRTVFERVDGLPMQRIVAELRPRFPVVDLAALPAALRLPEGERIAAQTVRAPFRLDRLPLFRILLIRLGEHDHICPIAIHHIVTDWISYYAMEGELIQIYEALRRGRPSPLPEPPLQFADFAVWQRERLADDELMAEQLAFWRRQLAGAPDLLPLPTDRPRPPVQTPWGARRRLAIGKARSDAFRSFAQGEGVTLFVAGLALFKMLLVRLSGQEKLIVGTPMAYRQGPEMQGVLGFFLNQLALYTDLSGNPTFRQAVRRERDVALAAYAHQDLPFARLVEELRPQRDLSRIPFTQVVFLLLNPHQLGRPEIGDLQAKPFWVDARRTQFDMTFSLWDHAGGLTGWMEYNTDLFDGTTIDRWKEQLRRLLAAALADPERRLWDLPLLGEAELHQLRCEWGAGPHRPEPADSVPERFARQAARTPDALAVAWHDRRLTYRELAAMAERLAHRLRGMGVRSETVVGLCLPRSPEMVAALLGILAAGGAYLPLDPEHPPARLGALLAESGARAVVGDAAALAILAGLAARNGGGESGGSFVLVDAGFASLPAAAAEPAGGARTAPPPESLAYVLYTSGSTGRPKGVMVTHAGLANYLAWCLEAYAPEAGSGAPVHSALGFDLTITALLAPLLAGRAVALVPEEAGLDGLATALAAAALAGERFALVKITPAHLELLRQTAPAAAAAGAATWVVGGEALSYEALAPWRVAGAGHAPRLINEYGPTEAVVGSTVYTVGPGDPPGGAVPIGRPIRNTSVHLLDRHGRPVPPGVTGELYLGGSGVARGYAGAPDQTAERFVPSPEPDAPGARLYRTGDLARFRATGDLEFLGRADAQIKLRGFRIEPAEIEAALRGHPAAVEAAVELRDGRLVAFVAPGGAAPSELRDFLRRRLPEHLVPADYVALPALPLTANGKVDRRALPAVARGRGEGAIASPRGFVEETLVAIWAEVLHLPGVGIHDGFFDLGGHSLLATQVVSRVRDVLEVELPLQALFEAPTVAELARRIAAAAVQAPSPPIARRPRGGPAPLSFAQQRLWFLDRMAPGSSFYNMYFGVRIEGPLALAALRASFAAVVRRQEGLRTAFPEVAGRPVQAVAEQLDLALPEIDLRALPGARRDGELNRLSQEESRRPFVLARLPLLRATFLRLGDADQALLLTLHHIIADGWSMGVLGAELSAVYDAFAAGLPSPLPELPVQYADFSAWQRGWLRDDVLAREIGFWKEQLAGPLPAIELPFDHPRPPVERFRGQAERLVLPGEPVDALRLLSRRERTTLFMTLLSAFAALLSRYTGQTDLLIGAPIAARTRTEVEGLIGFFVNTLVLRADVSGEPSARTLLARVRRTALAAFAHQDLPFEKLVEELAPERDPGRNPLTQVMFSMQNFPQQRPRFGGLDVRPLGDDALDTGTSKFDLTLFLWEVEGGVRTLLEYNRDLFEPQTAGRLLGHFAALVAAIGRDPAAPIAQLPLLAATERAELLALARGAGEPGLAPPPSACLHELFAAQAARRPQAPALTDGGRTLTYRELDRRANGLAWRLRELGVGPEVPVALHLERGARQVVAILGVLKAGGLYVPLETSLPADRLAYALADSGARVLVHDGAGLPAIPEISENPAIPQILLLDVAVEEGEELAERAAAPPVAVDPANAAYAIYTSGSTGRPKGVSVPHASVHRLLTTTAAAYGFSERDVWTLFHSYAFDFSVWEIWGALAFGGRLVVVPYLVSRAPESFAALLDAERVTVLNQTPSAFYQLIAAEERLGRPVGAALNWVVFGGEALAAGKLFSWFSRHGARPRLANMYGITETTVHATFGLVEAVFRRRPGSAAGRPLADLAIHLLDPRLAPLPRGVAGEIFVGGPGLARGYLGRPDLTAARFLPDPFAERPGERLYRSGDLARWGADSALEVLGRIDRQVKVRGFRIEPGEIEAALLAHPEVAAAAVVARADGEERRLVAYVVGAPAAAPGPLGERQAAQVAQWGSVFDAVYSAESAAEPAFDLAGWTDSYSGQPLAAAEMREWLDDALADVRALRPRRILEIGCGTGLLLWRLAPGAGRYVGTDLSRAALDRLAARLAAAAGPEVLLLHREGADFSGLADDSFDAVVLNSVVQYFPGAAYLERVLAEAVRVTAPGGAVFVGDVRSLPLLPALHASVLLARAPGGQPAADLARALAQRLDAEDELALAPAFFPALASRLPKIGRVAMRPKRVRAHNELSAFRYQVVLHVGSERPEVPAGSAAAAAPEGAAAATVPEGWAAAAIGAMGSAAAPPPGGDWRGWEEGGFSLATLPAALAEEAPERLALRDVPDARSAAAVVAARLLGAPGAVGGPPARCAPRRPRPTGGRSIPRRCSRRPRRRGTTPTSPSGSPAASTPS